MSGRFSHTHHHLLARWGIPSHHQSNPLHWSFEGRSTVQIRLYVFCRAFAHLLLKDGQQAILDHAHMRSTSELQVVGWITFPFRWTQHNLWQPVVRKTTRAATAVRCRFALLQERIQLG